MPGKKTGARTVDTAWSAERRYSGSEARRSGKSGGALSGDRDRPFYGTRLGLERVDLSDGRSMVAGRLTGRRVG
jgi:hypothetical protein